MRDEFFQLSRWFYFFLLLSSSLTVTGLWAQMSLPCAKDGALAHDVPRVANLRTDAGGLRADEAQPEAQPFLPVNAFWQTGFGASPVPRYSETVALFEIVPPGGEFSLRFECLQSPGKSPCWVRIRRQVYVFSDPPEYGPDGRALPRVEYPATPVILPDGMAARLRAVLAREVAAAKPWGGYGFGRELGCASIVENPNIARAKAERATLRYRCLSRKDDGTFLFAAAPLPCFYDPARLVQLFALLATDAPADPATLEPLLKTLESGKNEP